MPCLAIAARWVVVGGKVGKIKTGAGKLPGGGSVVCADANWICASSERLFGAGGKDGIGGGLRKGRGGEGEKEKNRGEFSARLARALYFRLPLCV